MPCLPHMRKSFIFYSSFYEAIKDVPKKHQLELYNAIMEYVIEDKTPKLSGISKTLWTLIEPNLEANNKKYESGSRGGRPKTKTSGFDKKITSGFENKKPNEDEDEDEDINTTYLVQSTKAEPKKKDKPFGDIFVNKTLQCFELVYGFPPLDKKPRQYAHTLVKRIEKFYRDELKIPLADDAAKLDKIEKYFSWVSNEDSLQNVKNMEVITRNYTMFKAKILKQLNGGIHANNHHR
jgi:hypothetical protein